MRTFIALELPPGFSDEVAGLARQLKLAMDGRFMERESYHITLAFLGGIDDAQAARAMDAAEAACANQPPVPLRAAGLGKFGRSDDATLWLGIDRDPAIMQLAMRVREELEAHDLRFDEKDFMPHVTLARRARLPKGELSSLPFPSADVACAVTLFKSTLSSEGATYKPLHTVPLDAACAAL